MIPIYTDFEMGIAGTKFRYRDGEHFVNNVKVSRDEYNAAKRDAEAKLPKQ